MRKCLCNSKKNDLLFSGKFKPVGPEKLLEEVEKHKEEIAEKARKKLEEIELAIKLLEPEYYPKD